MDINALIDSWKLTSDLNVFNPAASDEEIEEAERLLGIELPVSLKTIFGFSNGFELLEGNLQVVPLKSDDGFHLAAFTPQLREWGTPVPQQVLAFGDNGSDSTFGVWLPDNSMSSSPVIEIGAIHTPNCMAIAGTSLFHFLLGWTAYYFMLLEVDSKALDIIQLPEELRFDAQELEEEHFAAIRKWADPQLPNFTPDPYVQKYDASDIKNILGSSAT
jgi:hypothetical protein